MAFATLKLRRHLISLLLRGILKSLRVRRKANRNSDLLTFSRELERNLWEFREKMYRKQEEMILFSVNFDGALDATNIFFKRLEKNVRKRLHSSGVDESLRVNLEFDEDHKSP